jgi:class 3 adenylate cyclase
MRRSVDAGGKGGEPERVTRSVVVADLVESVRLMQRDELDVIARWRRFVGEVVAELLPARGGRLVKSLGDGMLLDFADPLSAAEATLELHERLRRANAGYAPERHFWLRCAVHETEVVVDELDVYGAGVNLAARLARLARPGESVVSATVRDAIALDIDAELDDLGACHLKHVNGAVRAWRISGRGAHRRPDTDPGVPWLPTLLVLPFQPAGEPHGDGLCGVLCDDLIATLAESRMWRLLSGVTAREVGERPPSLLDLHRRWGVTYVLSGRCVRRGPRLRVRCELAEARSGRVVWCFEHRGATAQVFDGDPALHQAIRTGLAEALAREEMARGKRLALHERENYSLLAQGLSAMQTLLAAPLAQPS